MLNNKHVYTGQFFHDTQPPKEMHNLVMGYLNDQEKRVTNTVSKDWYYIYSEDLRISSGAETEDEFMERLESLSFDKLKHLVLQKIYNLNEAEIAKEILDIVKDRRIEVLLEVFEGKDFNMLEEYLREIVLSKASKFTPDEVAVLTTPVGVTAIRSGVITPDIAKETAAPSNLLTESNLEHILKPSSRRGVY